MFGFIKTAGLKLQLDRSLAIVLASRAWQVLSGPLTILLMVRFFSLSEQGFYYSIFNVLAIQSMFELGLLNILVGHAGNASAIVSDVSRSVLSNSKEDQHQDLLRRLAELDRSSSRWFLVASGLYLIAGLSLGWYLFSGADSENDVSWRLPFAVSMVFATVTLRYSPRMAILEGVGFRETVYRFRLYQMVSGSLLLWLCLVAGFKLWSLVFVTALQTGWVLFLAFVHFHVFFATLRTTKEPAKSFSWSRDVLPAQWRMAVVGLSHQLATQYFALVLLYFHGTEAAGRLGMTITITGALQMISLAWLQTKYPVISSCHGRNDREMAGTLWRRATLVSTVLLVIGLAIFALAVFCSPWIEPRIADRFISPLQILILGCGMVANHIVASQSFYLLSRRLGPLLIALPCYLLSTASMLLGGYLYSTTGMAVGYALTFVLTLLPAHTWMYLRIRHQV